MNSESIKLLKEAVYYIKKAEFEKQSALKGRSMSKAVESGTKAIKGVWGWVKGLGSKNKPNPDTPPQRVSPVVHSVNRDAVPKYNATIPENSMLDTMIQRDVRGQIDTAHQGPTYDQDINDLLLKRRPKLFSDTWRPVLYPVVPGSTYRPDGGAVYGLLAARDVNNALDGILPPRIRKYKANEFLQANLKTPQDVADFEMLVKSDSLPLNMNQRELRRMAEFARSADMFQYLAKKYYPSRQGFFETLMAVPGRGGTYSPYNHRITVGSKMDPTVMGHELGHAIYLSRPNIPEDMKNLNLWHRFALDKTNPGNPFGYLPETRFNELFSKGDIPENVPENVKYAHSLYQLLNEIGANHELHKLMRHALRDNPELYGRFRQYSDNILMPSLSTYATTNPELFMQSMKNLPPSAFPVFARRYIPNLQAAAERQWREHQAFAPNMTSHLLKDPDFRSSDPKDYNKPLDKMFEALYARTKRQDPTLYSDIYDYLIQNGETLPQNTWYNHFFNTTQPQRPIDMILNYSRPVFQNVGFKHGNK